jgi:beta-fructofuranosidase
MNFETPSSKASLERCVKEKSNLVTTRREFLIHAAAAGAMVALPMNFDAQEARATAVEAKLAADPMRPQFHLLPAKNWMNDPNGPIYFNGSYHMFFQYNPQAAVWGDMSWNHAISTDMLHWTHLPLALTPSPGSPDSFGCFSGSAIAVGKRVYAVYTGTRESAPELATIRDGSDKIQESQCLAWSDNPNLITWTKDRQPIVPLPPPGMKITGFRDPSVWKQRDWYYMTVGSGVAQVGGCVLLYRSRDLKSWEYLHPLTAGKWNGKKTANPCDDGEMWECPEFFPLDGGHVLIYSTLGKVFWQSGELDEATMTFKSMKTGLLDLDAFYAPKTQLDAQGRRILWGWIPERRSDAALRAAGWSGMMSLPRRMRLDSDGTLRIQTLPQVSTLRAGILLAEKTPAGQRVILPNASGEALCSGARGSALQWSISDGAREILRVSYSPERHAFVTEGREVALQPADLPTLHAFVDGSVVELILGERIGYTKRFYFDSPQAPDIAVVATGSGRIALGGWKISPVSTNRLTTPAREA